MAVKVRRALSINSLLKINAHLQARSPGVAPAAVFATMVLYFGSKRPPLPARVFLSKVYLQQVDVLYSEVIVVFSKKHELSIPNQPTQAAEAVINSSDLLAIY